MKNIGSFLFWVIAAALVFLSSGKAPNVILIVADDVGWADLSLGRDEASIQTTFIDELSAGGVRISNHYVHPTCTPSRASLMTGRYAYKLGFSFAVFPGSPVGLPSNVTTLPQVMREAGYRTAMAGKWHLGYAQLSQTPVGRGFEKWIGCFICNIDAYTKQAFELPWKPLALDWAEFNEDGSYRHFVDPRHVTTAISENAIDMIHEHSHRKDENPLFLYVAYTAAHSPLQPDPRHLEKCGHIPHYWRRMYCGLIMGVDEGVKNITTQAREILGENTIIIFLSDNGGSPWFGGLNEPFRGGKTSPYEGGVKVPAFVFDMTTDKRYFGRGGRSVDDLFHISDWFKTIMAIGNVTTTRDLSEHDGIDQSCTLRGSCRKQRNEVVLDLFTEEEGIFGDSMIAIRHGDIKLVKGWVRDGEWYRESNAHWLNSTDKTFASTLGELMIKSSEMIYTQPQFDTARHVLVHGLVMRMLDSRESTSIYNITDDPAESRDLSRSHPELLRQMLERANFLKSKKLPQLPVWLELEESLRAATWISGNCSQSSEIKVSECMFLHPWLSDDADPVSGKLRDGRSHIREIITVVIKAYVATLILLLLSTIVIGKKFYSCISLMSVSGSVDYVHMIMGSIIRYISQLKSPIANRIRLGSR